MDIPNSKKSSLNDDFSELNIDRPKNILSQSIDSTETKVISTIGDLLKQHTPYDLLPISYKVIMLDHHLPVKKALGALLHNGINYAPLFNSETQSYSGLLTSNDFISLIQYFHNKPSFQEAMDELDSMEVGHIKEVETRMGVISEKTNFPHINPFASLMESGHLILKANSHILPVIDRDPNTQQDTIVTVLTMYRILKFLAVNYRGKAALNLTLKDIGIGTYDGLVTASFNDKVLDVVNMFMERRIAAVPILDENRVVLNVFENNDVMALLKEGDFSLLECPLSEALRFRSESFEGVHRCQSSDTLRSIMETIKKEVVNRLVVVDANDRIEGIVTLSDILKYFLTNVI